ncbi:MAG TPA: dynamin family protein [Kofleriaceae bacterium]|jgi:tetratricopeptide (TPR) repeat protein|nr:dynamin family protein [Kofleriaceae bacterium]
MSLWSRVQRRLGDLAGELVLDEYREYLDRAQQLLSVGDVTAATELLETVLAAKPEHGQALIALGDARLIARDAARALAAFERALELRPGDPAALVGHGLALVALASYEPAITSLGRAVAEAAGDRGILADAYRGLGIAWRRNGDIDKAIRELRKAVAEDSEDIDARAALGEALVADAGASAGPHGPRGSDGSYDEALRHLERAVAADAPPGLALYALGRIALAETAVAVAIDRLGRARAIAERDPTPLGAQVRFDVIVAQGDAALAARDAHGAHGFFLEALQVEPRRADLHAKIAQTHRSIGNLDAALASFERALALGAGVDTLRAAVDTAIAAGDPLRQARWASDLLAIDPTDVRAIVARGAAMAADQPDAARALLELAAARDDVDAHVWLARFALARDPAAAQASALAALRVAPRHGRARQLLTEAHAALLGGPGDAADIGELARFIQNVVGVRRELGHLVGDVARAAANLDQPLLVTVMGEFSSGKSSFVNAFIGADVAPTGITPTTATINVVRYGRERGGRVVGAGGAGAELGWDALMAHLRALTPEAARAIDRVEILVPLPQLEKIHIVDTPGLNSIQPEHEATARGFIARADAVVWVFTASQGGKASEKRALHSIRDEGKRVLGVLNKADQLSAEDTAEVVQFITGELGDLVEAVVPFSARRALAWKRAPDAPTEGDPLAATGNWTVLEAALEQRFFQQARQLKRDGCVRALRAVVGEARTAVEAVRRRAGEAADAARAGRDELLAAARAFTAGGVVVERKALSDASTALYRRAAREVLDLVRPRRLPFSSHTATVADRDYLISLLSSGFDAAIEAGRRRVAAELTRSAGLADTAARTLSAALGVDVVGDLQRAADDQIGLALSRVFDRARAFLRGYLAGGYVEGFFRNDVPRLELAEDAVYHALMRGAPDLDRELGEPLTRAATDALSALANRLDHWAAVLDVHAFDVEVGVGRALELAAARLA